MGGVGVSRWLIGYWEVATILFAVLSLALFRRFGILLILVFCFGFWRGYETDFHRTLLGRNVGQEVSVEGMVADDPGVNERNQVSFTVSNAELNGVPTHQTVRIYGFNRDPHRGYLVRVTGKLKEGRGSVPAMISYGEVEVLSDRINWLEQLRQKIFMGTKAAIPDPLNGFGLGLLIGVRAIIDKQVQDNLTLVGMSHLVAVSGYNLTIIIQAARRFLLPISSFFATAASFWLISAFLLVTGFGSSIVRASIVSGFSLVTAYYGYDLKPMSLISLTAIITVAWHPDYMTRDIGWMLSFLAFFGVIVIAPLIEARFFPRPNAIVSLVNESVSAQITTTPLILALFANVSMVSPISNTVVLPLVPLAMLMSFVVGIVSLIDPVLAAVIGLPATGLLGLMIGLVEWFASWPYANIQLRTQTYHIYGMYVIILGFTLMLYRKVGGPKMRESTLGGTFAPDR